MTIDSDRGPLNPDGMEPLMPGTFEWVCMEFSRLMTSPDTGRLSIGALEDAVDRNKLWALGMSEQTGIGAHRIIRVPNAHAQIRHGAINLTLFDPEQRKSLVPLFLSGREGTETGVLGRIGFKQKVSDETFFSGQMFLTVEGNGGSIVGIVRCGLSSYERINPQLTDIIGDFAGSIGLRSLWLEYLNRLERGEPFEPSFQADDRLGNTIGFAFRKLSEHN